ncbi:glycosyltransferase family 4 protein [Enterovibrio calviensis]|uniref:glycosyltransferase family 4 protein n=1 Tax=Enterovibrio calviensis TaxID=91359 RepID=UPI0004878A75|nr:glycosyltransferase family 4 protein [Enterovibrio calviensis]
MELDAIKQTKLFVDNGLDAILICREGTFLEQLAKEQRIKFKSIKFKAKLSLPLIKGLRDAIKDERLSTLIFFGASEIKSIYFAVQGTGCRVIVRHGTTKSSSKKDPIHRLFYSCVSDFVGISQHLTRNILQVLPAKPSSVHTIYNSLDSGDIRKNENSPLTFLHVGRVEEGKGVFDAVLALGQASIPPENKVLTFLGNVESTTVKEKLSRLATANQVKVIFEGFCNNVTPFYQKNSFLLFPSHGEGLGNVVLEAISNGLRCITYDNTVFPEYVSLGFEGFYFAENRNITMLSKAIENAFFDDDNEFFEKNSLIFPKFFSPESNLKAWNELLFDKR